jgi:hypothetical protein
MMQEIYKLAKNDARVLQMGQNWFKSYTNWPKMVQEFYKLAKNDARLLQISQKWVYKSAKWFSAKHSEYYKFKKVQFAGISCRQIHIKFPDSDPGVLKKFGELLGDSYKKFKFLTIKKLPDRLRTLFRGEEFFKC